MLIIKPWPYLFGMGRVVVGIFVSVALPVTVAIARLSKAVTK